MRKMALLALLVSCCTILGGCTSNSFRRTFFMQDEKGIIDPYFHNFISAINHHDAPAILALFAPSISANNDLLTEQIESTFSYFPDDLMVTSGATAVQSSYDISANRHGEIDAIFIVEADGQVFYAAMKICSEDSAESENIGIVSIYFINSQNYHSDVYYRGDGQWTPGINLQ